MNMYSQSINKSNQLWFQVLHFFYTSSSNDLQHYTSNFKARKHPAALGWRHLATTKLPEKLRHGRMCNKILHKKILFGRNTLKYWPKWCLGRMNTEAQITEPEQPYVSLGSRLDIQFSLADHRWTRTVESGVGISVIQRLHHSKDDRRQRSPIVFSQIGPCGLPKNWHYDLDKK